MPIEIRLATTEADREAVYRFRYAVFVEEMGRRPPDADHERGRLTDALPLIVAKTPTASGFFCKW